MVRGVSPFGDGFAAERIVDVIADWHPSVATGGARIQAAV